MNDINALERRTQNRVVGILQNSLGYRYIGNLENDLNENIRPNDVIDWLTSQGLERTLAEKALSRIEHEANDSTKSLYDRNKKVYELLRYGVKVQEGLGEHNQTVFLVDWKNPLANDFAVAEEVTVEGQDGYSSTKRPDVVLYINGIALAVLELKRSTVSVSEGIRQNLDNQRPEFIQRFFSTMQWVMAGNDTQGLHYGTIGTPEKYYLTWKEPGSEPNLLDRSILQVCEKTRLLELIHDFVAFDSGTKKLCRPNQYFGVKAAQLKLAKSEGGIIWHTQGSGKSLTMVWLSKWIKENIEDPRVLILTDRTELDEQIEGVFKGVNEQIYRTNSGSDLISTLNTPDKWLVCSLIHKFGRRINDEEDTTDFVEQVMSSLPQNFAPKGNIFVFIDECHRTQSGRLHDAMKAVLPQATFVGFTGTPLMQRDKKTSLERFGTYIHTYKFDEAVADGVVVDLRYEARNIDQRITSQGNIDKWFAAKTAGLNDVARATLKKRWGTMQQVLSSRSRLEQVVSDIMLDMATRPRLMSDRGNAILVASTIFEACRYFEIFSKTPLKGKCGIVTSYEPSLSDIKGENAGEGDTLPVQQFNIYRQMLADWFGVKVEETSGLTAKYESQVKKKFLEEPGQMKLLIVVDKLLTGFDAPSATYLYIDKQMRDHGLFQAICRVNRLDGEDKDYGYIVDYKDLFKTLEDAMNTYTTEAFDGYDEEDVKGLLSNRIERAKLDFDEALEAIRGLVEPVSKPRGTLEYVHYFCAEDPGNLDQIKANEERRFALYKCAGKVLSTFAGIADEYVEAGYDKNSFEELRKELETYEAIRTEVKLASGDYVDLKLYEPAMRHLIDTYIKADETEKISAFDNMSFIELLATKGEDAVNALPASLAHNPKVAAEVIANNVRRLIVEESPINPRYFEKMSELLDAIIEHLRNERISYKEYLAKVAELAKQIINPAASSSYPATISSPGKRAIFDFLEGEENLALEVDIAVHSHIQDGWRTNPHKRRRVRNAVVATMGDAFVSNQVDQLMDILVRQNDY